MIDPTIHTWNKVATLYEEKFMPLTIYNESYDQFSALLNKPDALVLDVGAGPGNISGYLHRNHPDWHFHGVDAAPNMVELFRKNIPGSTVTVMDIRNIGSLKTTFDGIVAGFCIPYLNDQDTDHLIQALSKMLNQQGCLYISFVEGDPASSGLLTSSTGDQTYFYYHPLQRIQELMQAAGMQLSPVIHVLYTRSADQQEMHTILIGKL